MADKEWTPELLAEMLADPPVDFKEARMSNRWRIEDLQDFAERARRPIKILPELEIVGACPWCGQYHSRLEPC